MARADRRSIVTERSGSPIPVAIGAADLHDGLALGPLVRGIPPIRSRRGIESEIYASHPVTSVKFS